MASHTSRHHRKPRSLGGITSKENISYIGEEKHRCWHELFHNWTPDKICREINEKYLDPEYMLICIKREE